MAPRTLSDEQVGQVRGYLSLNWSYSVIIKTFMTMGIAINKRIISAIANNKYVKVRSSHAESPGPKRKADGRQLRRLRSWLDNANPPTQKDMAKRLNVSPKTIRNYAKILKRRLVKKGKVHALSPASVLKRHQRSYQLYHRLKKGRVQQYITSDEAWIYLTGREGERDVQYLHHDQSWTEKENQPHVSHPKGIMVWVAFDWNRIFKPRFVKPGCKVDSGYYIKHVLTPFVKEYKRYYPQNNMIFHQDSAPAHTATKTQAWLHANRLKYIEPSAWLPNSPDAAPCDYWLGVSSRRV